MWSPDSPGNDAVKTRTKPGNPEARTNNCLGETLNKIVPEAPVPCSHSSELWSFHMGFREL